MRRSGRIGAIGVIFAMASWGARGQTASPPAPPPAPSTAAAEQPVELDHVVAIIGSSVLLESDIEQEMHFAALEPLQVLPGQNTPDAAMRRLMDRTLILQQMKQQQQAVTTPAAEVQTSLAELRAQIPACTQAGCETAKGWGEFLKSGDLNEEAVEQRWSQRMAILRFIDLRFQSGIRISQEQIAAYYQKTLVPALAQKSEKAPPLPEVSKRIQELLLQQQVSGLFQDWVSSLRDQGNVQIVDQAYASDLEPNPVEPSQ